MFKLLNLFIIVFLCSSYAKGLEKTGLNNKIALLPILNNSGNITASDFLEKKIEESLINSGYEVVPSTKLRDVLRKYRIRNLGQMMKFSSKFLSSDFKLKWIGVSSIDVYESKGVPEISISFRIVKIENMEIYWANTVSLSGKDGGWFFEMGSIKNIEKLAHKAVAELFSQFPLKLKDKENASKDLKMSLVAFDNLTSHKTSNQLVEDILISNLMKQSIVTLEPGALQYFFNLNQQSPIGEIDLTTLKELHQFMNLDYVITGTIDVMEYGGNNFNYLNPKIELTIKLLNCKTAKIDGIWHIYESAEDAFHFFQIGKEISIGRLINKIFEQNLIDKIKKQLVMRG